MGPAVPVTGEDAVTETAELKRVLQRLLDEAVQSYPQHEVGAWWVPASYGGTAPSLEEAARLDVQERRERAAQRTPKAS